MYKRGAACCIFVCVLAIASGLTYSV